MKKLLSLFLVISLAGALSACGGNNKSNSAPKSNVESGAVSKNQEEIEKLKDEAEKLKQELAEKEEAEKKEQETIEAQEAAAKEQEKVAAAEVMNQIALYYSGAELEEKSYNYIVDHSNLFPAGTVELKKEAESLVDSNVTSRHIFKNISPYLEKMIKVSGDIVEIEEEETDFGTVSEIHIIDDNDNSVIGIYLGSTGDILDGDFVTMRGVPTVVYSFDNIGGGTTNAVLLAASTIQKQ